GVVGGCGRGAGLMYVMDADKVEERRDMVRGYMVNYGRQTGDLLDGTRRTLGRQAQAVRATTRMPFRHQPGFGERLLTQATQLGMTTGVILVGCVGLGAGSSALLEPQGDPQRRARLADKRAAYCPPPSPH